MLTIYKIKFFEKIQFMARPLSTVEDNLTEGLHKHKAKDCKSNLDYVRANDSILTLKHGK